MALKFMDENKDDKYYISEIIETLDIIIKYMKGQTFDKFIKDKQLIDSVCFRFVLLNSSIKRISENFWIKNSNIKINEINGFRNRLVRDYGDVDYYIVYKTAKTDVKTLKFNF